MLNVVKRSIVKGLRDTAITIGSIGALAGLAAAQDPEVLAPLVAVVGPYGAVVLFVVPWVAKTAADLIKHRNDPPPEGP
jgi:hypothetical protein